MMEQICLERKDDQLVLTIVGSLSELDLMVHDFLRQLELNAKTQEIENKVVEANRGLFAAKICTCLGLDGQFAYRPVKHGQVSETPLLNQFGLKFLTKAEEATDFVIAQWSNRVQNQATSHDELVAA